MNVQLILIKTLQLLCCLSLLVVLHEGGHFGFSKLFKVRVEKFYMFFNPKFHLFSTRDNWFTRLFPYFKNNETEYGIGWIPLGGYVKIAGMIDESMDTEQMKQPAKPDEFRAQPVWKRFFIMVGGVMMNIVTALVIYCAIMFTWGQDELPMRNLSNGFSFNESAEQLGFRDGDIPVSIDGNEIGGWRTSVMRDISNARTVTVLRDGKEVVLQMPKGGINMLEMLEMQPPFMTLIAPAQIDSVVPESPLYKMGVKKGATILSVDGTAIRYWSDYDSLYLRKQDILSTETCTRADSVAQRRMTLVVQNAGAEQADTLTFQLNDQYQMGVTRVSPIDESVIEHRTYSFLSCIPAGCKYCWNVLSGYVNDLKYVFSKKGAQTVGSFVTIGSIFPDTWVWERFWEMTAFISIILAVMNILPIPGLDGGHVVLLLYEGITGREPSEKVQTWLEYIGMAIILCLMILGLGNDIHRFIFK